MKKHITLFAIMTLFLAGSYSSIGQEVENKMDQEQYANKKRQLAEAQKAELVKAKMTPEMIAKKQTLHLKQLLDLDDKQISRVHEICTSIEHEMSTIPVNIEEEKRMKLINDLEALKNEKLKEVLTADQFKMYQNSFNKEK